MSRKRRKTIRGERESARESIGWLVVWAAAGSEGGGEGVRGRHETDAEEEEERQTGRGVER